MRRGGCLRSSAKLLRVRPALEMSRWRHPPDVCLDVSQERSKTAGGCARSELHSIPRSPRKRLPMHFFRPVFALCASLLATLSLATPSFAARCGGDFNGFVAAMSQEAQAAGVLPTVILQALSVVSQDAAALDCDRGQR